MTTYFKAGDSIETFGKGITKRSDDNGSEYQLFGHIVDLLNEDCFKPLSAQSPVHASAAPFIRRFGKGGMFYLKTEDTKIDGFPDFFVVRNDVVCVIDHFRIDSSARRNRRGDNGTEYMALIGRYGGDYDSAARTAILDGTPFSSASLVETIQTGFKKKSEKLPRYECIVRQYIEDSPSREIAKEDGGKPIELWLLVENTSPQKFQFGEIAIDTLEKAIDDSRTITGVIYANCGYSDKLPQSVSDIMFIVQDGLDGRLSIGTQIKR